MIIREYRSNGSIRGGVREETVSVIIARPIEETQDGEARAVELEIQCRGILAGRLIVQERDEVAIVGRLLPPGVYATCETITTVD